ncbi:hypothetical protein QUB30_21445 [Microcoleus sp. BROC3]
MKLMLDRTLNRFMNDLRSLYSSVAVELAQPHPRISIEMVFCGLYDFSRAVWRDRSTNVVSYVVETLKMLGLIKQQRKQYP